jgi:membrane protein involved in colicin uptake
MEKLIGAYIELAFMDVSNYKGEVCSTVVHMNRLGEYSSLRSLSPQQD